MTLKRICIHWTAGALTPNDLERQHYHFIVDFEGIVHAGHHKPEANGKQLSNRDKYAAHCGGGNSFTIGIAVCGGPKTFTRESLESLCKKVAELCVKYRIPIDTEHVYTHYEFGLRHKGTDSAGKIDINTIPWEPQMRADKVGDFIRTSIKWYKTKL